MTFYDRENLVKLPLYGCDSKMSAWGKRLNTSEHARYDQKDYSVKGETELVLRDHDKRCIELIRKSDTVFGCVAWITHPEILDALSGCEEVQIVVNKEDFLRPDYTDAAGPADSSKQYKDLYSRYMRLNKGVLATDSVGRAARDVAWGGGMPVGGIRCVGLSLKKRWSPKMHHKFAVFTKGCGRGLHLGGCSVDEETGERDSSCGRCEEEGCFATAWIGSFNWTKNATKSFESVIITRDPAIVDALLWEHSQILVMSEPLDWESPYVEPEYATKIGES